MRFNQVLLKGMVAEWIKLYLNFSLLDTYLQIPKELKEFLNTIKKMKLRQEYKTIKKSVMGKPLLMLKLENDNKRFMETFCEEMEKVETFGVWKYNDLKMKLTKLKAQVKMMGHEREDLDTRALALTRQWNFRTIFAEGSTHDSKKKLQNDKNQFSVDTSELLETFYRFYHEAQFYKSYLVMNNEAKKRILKKYHKRGLLKMKQDYIENKDNLNFMIGKSRQLSEIIKQVMTVTYYPNNPKACSENLKKYSEGGRKVKQHHVFIFGFFMGYIVVNIIILLFMSLQGYLDPETDAVFNKVFPCFRGMALFLTYYWFLAIDVWAYEHFKLNYKIFLNFNHHFSTATQLIKRASIMSSIYLIIFIVYILQQDNISQLLVSIEFFNPRYLPIIPWVIAILYVLVPTVTSFNGEGRMWMYRMGWGAIFGHFLRSEPRYIFFTDQFVSMVTPFKDLNYTMCYYYFDYRYGVEPKTECENQNRISSLIPFMIPQILKCLMFITRARDKGKFWGTDEMWNFFKILLAIQVGYLAFLAKYYVLAREIWIPVAIISSLWMYYWDITKDWMFFQPNARHKFLRDDLGYNHPFIYYGLAVLNLPLRATWVLSISPEIYLYLGIKSELFGLLVGFLEMTRRLISNFMRIEKEHILNENALRTVVDYKFPFLDRVSLTSLVLEKRDEALSRLTVSSFMDELNEMSPSTEQEQEITAINLEIQESVMDRKSLLGKDTNKDTYKKKTSSSFRVSDIIHRQTNQSTGGQSAIYGKSVNMDIIVRAKKQEKHQLKMIQNIQMENSTFQTMIKNLYEKHKILQ